MTIEAVRALIAESDALIARMGYRDGCMGHLSVDAVRAALSESEPVAHLKLRSDEMWCMHCPTVYVVDDDDHRAWHARQDVHLDSRRWAGALRPMRDPYRSVSGPLAEFVLARIADDEDEARDAASRPHSGSCCRGFDSFGCECDYAAQVLAECSAKRSIIALHPEAVDTPLRAGAAWAYDEVLRRLALPFADHPDYREEWKP